MTTAAGMEDLRNTAYRLKFIRPGQRRRSAARNAQRLSPSVGEKRPAPNDTPPLSPDKRPCLAAPATPPRTQLNGGGNPGNEVVEIRPAQGGSAEHEVVEVQGTQEMVRDGNEIATKAAIEA